jgi:hypothetical protein
MKRLPKEVISALEQTGLPWSFEAGGKHFHLRLDGKLIHVCSKNGNWQRRFIDNALRSIRHGTRK